MLIRRRHCQHASLSGSSRCMMEHSMEHSMEQSTEHSMEQSTEHASMHRCLGVASALARSRLLDHPRLHLPPGAVLCGAGHGAAGHAAVGRGGARAWASVRGDAGRGVQPGSLARTHALLRPAHDLLPLVCTAPLVQRAFGTYAACTQHALGVSFGMLWTCLHSATRVLIAAHPLPLGAQHQRTVLDVDILGRPLRVAHSRVVARQVNTPRGIVQHRR